MSIIIEHFDGFGGLDYWVLLFNCVSFRMSRIL